MDEGICHVYWPWSSSYDYEQLLADILPTLAPGTTAPCLPPAYFIGPLSLGERRRLRRGQRESRVGSYATSPRLFTKHTRRGISFASSAIHKKTGAGEKKVQEEKKTRKFGKRKKKGGVGREGKGSNTNRVREKGNRLVFTLRNNHQPPPPLPPANW